MFNRYTIIGVMFYTHYTITIIELHTQSLKIGNLNKTLYNTSYKIRLFISGQ